jgi:hypothetical protein
MLIVTHPSAVDIACEESLVLERGKRYSSAGSGEIGDSEGCGWNKKPVLTTVTHHCTAIFSAGKGSNMSALGVYKVLSLRSISRVHIALQLLARAKSRK